MRHRGSRPVGRTLSRMAGAIDPGGILAVIPARGGSKGIPKKNLALVGGVPLLRRAIEQAAGARHIGRVVVSTDDREIASAAEAARAEVVLRPAGLATDAAPTELALLHVLETLRAREGYEPQAVVTLEPTSPLRTSRLIDRCIETLFASGAESVLTVVETRACLGTLADGGRFAPLLAGQPRRRQDRPPLYEERSVVYVTRTPVLRARRSVLGGEARAVVVAPEEAIDINTTLDLAIAEAVLEWRQQQEGATP